MHGTCTTFCKGEPGEEWSKPGDYCTNRLLTVRSKINPGYGNLMRDNLVFDAINETLFCKQQDGDHSCRIKAATGTSRQYF